MICFIHRFPKFLLGAGKCHTPGRRQRNSPPSTFRYPSLPLRRLQNSYWELWNTTLLAMGPSWVLLFTVLFFLLFLFVAFPFYSPPLLAPSHTSPPAFVSRLLFLCRYRSLGFSFLLLFCFGVSASSQFPLGPRPIRVSG